MTAMTDYWLSKLFYDLQNPAAAAAYRADRAATLDRYPLEPAARAAVLADDVAVLAQRVNPYLLRYYCTAAGMGDAEFLARIRATGVPVDHSEVVPVAATDADAHGRDAGSHSGAARG